MHSFKVSVCKSRYLRQWRDPAVGFVSRLSHLSLQMLAKLLLARCTLRPGIVTQTSTCFCSVGAQVEAIEKLLLKQLNGASNSVGYVGDGSTVRSVWQVRMDGDQRCHLILSYFMLFKGHHLGTRFPWRISAC